MVQIVKDGKSDTFIITKTDSEGFHRQLNVTKDELTDLIRKGIRLCFNKN